jgi:hypothetical protein
MPSRRAVFVSDKRAIVERGLGTPDAPAVTQLPEPARSAELQAALASSVWFLSVLDDVASVDPPQWWVGAGVIRDVVWEQRFGKGADRPETKDVDVAYFDAADLSSRAERNVEGRLRARNPQVAWDAKNQAAVHRWYAERFGTAVTPLASVPEAVATWPEYATCVAVRLTAQGKMGFCAPHGLDDLLDGLWRRNPSRVTVDEYRRRLADKQPESRWPGVRVVP